MLQGSAPMSGNSSQLRVVDPCTFSPQDVDVGRQAHITSQLAQYTCLQHVLVAQNVLWQVGLDAGIAAQQSDE